MLFYTIVFMIIFVFILIIAFFIMNKNKKDLETDGEFRGNSKVEESRYYDNGIFELEIEDLFTITGRGTVVTGKIQSGTIRKDDKVIIISSGGEPKEAEVKGIEAFRKKLESATKGDNVGLILKYSGIFQIKKGDKIIKR